MACWSLLLPLLAVSVVNALESPGSWEFLWESQDDYDTVKYPQRSCGRGFANFSYSGTVKSTGRPYTIYIATLSKGLPDTFGFELPSSGRSLHGGGGGVSQSRTKFHLASFPIRLPSGVYTMTKYSATIIYNHNCTHINCDRVLSQNDHIWNFRFSQLHLCNKCWFL